MVHMQIGACGCCCCCCCCLHSLGSLVGAGIASAIPFKKPSGEREASAAPLYWFMLALGTASVVGGSLANGLWDWGSILLLIVLVLPAIQLGASFVAMVAIAVVPRFEDKNGYMSSLGRITLLSLAGTMIGIMVMGVGLMCLSVFR